MPPLVGSPRANSFVKDEAIDEINESEAAAADMPVAKDTESNKASVEPTHQVAKQESSQDVAQ